ncbi:MAG TPA: type II toxin-antitoxin system CcdA family antitoxin [Acidimicrobiales bacterium]|nr:type II toxin-antitoxin system CcdA family antitoxin [Acidimicrobiales bacterium]
MTLAKRKISVSLDADLVDEMELDDEPVSAQVNEAIKVELNRRRRQRLLGEWLDRLDEEHGPVPEEVIQRYEGLLS